MKEDDIKLELLQVCKVKGWDSDINMTAFHALCDELVKLGAAEMRKHMIYASPHIWSTEAVRLKLAEMANEVEKMPFGDTAASFAAWIRAQHDIEALSADPTQLKAMVRP